MKIQKYSPEIEVKMRHFYNSLSEKDRRRYAAIEAEKLGYGGASYIRQLFNCDNRTILHGKQDLKLDISKENGNCSPPLDKSVKIVSNIIHEKITDVK
ncbi:hypothetical protein QUF54_01500 [Candidatus Marithioploca araucensis]|uniref:Transposase n=1 Tax=Candidatus Marithioploca araucensis TaxID=70273 RepID=A0ABT7VQS8_9GAMM|nr:hypothetical protein [Candidatus Marithioploca araucensis]